jgi:hypothetical protein
MPTLAFDTVRQVPERANRQGLAVFVFFALILEDLIFKPPELWRFLFLGGMTTARGVKTSSTALARSHRQGRRRSPHSRDSGALVTMQVQERGLFLWKLPLGAIRFT